MGLRALGFVVAGAALVFSHIAQAAPIFNFEGVTYASEDTGYYTSLTQTSGGLTAVFKRQGGGAFDIDDLSTPGVDGPASFGSRSLSPFYNSTSSSPFVINFSQGLRGLSFQAGDFNSNDLDTITLEVFSAVNGNGTLLGSVSYNYGARTLPDDIATLSLLTNSAFRSALVIGGSNNFPNSVFYDNFQATVAPVPLPATIPLFSLALLGLGLWGWKRKDSPART